MKILALCHTCAHKHPIEFDPRIGPGAAFSDWMVKHPEHAIDFVWPGRSQKASPELGMLAPYIPNADIKLSYAASAAYTITLASLASSASFLAGREGAAVLNTTNKYLDYLVGGKITVGTTPTTNTQIRVYAYGSVNDTPLYPDVLDGTDSAETITNAEILLALPILAEIPIVATTSDVAYWILPKSIAAAFGGLVPAGHGLFVAHNTGVALNATGANHALSATGVFATAT